MGLILGSAGLELSIKHTVVTLNMTPECCDCALEVIDNRRCHDIIAAGTWGVNVMRLVARAISIAPF